MKSNIGCGATLVREAVFLGQRIAKVECGDFAWSDEYHEPTVDLCPECTKKYRVPLGGEDY